MTTINGAMVTLRTTVEADRAELLRIRRTPEVHARWRGDDLEAEFEKDLDDAEVHQFTIVRRGDAAIVGLVQYGEEEEPDYRHASVDIYIDPAAHRQGLGLDAIRTLVRHCIDDRGHHRLTIDPAADNEPAIACYAAAGFKAVGTMRQYERQADGTWSDGLLMEFLASDHDA